MREFKDKRRRENAKNAETQTDPIRLGEIQMDMLDDESEDDEEVSMKLKDLKVE